MTQCLVLNDFYTNFNVLSGTRDTVGGLELFLHQFQYFNQDVLHSVWFRMVITLIPAF